MLIVMIVVYHLLYCETFNYYRRWWYWWWFDDDDVTVVIAVILRVMVALILQSWNKFYSRSDHFGRSHKAGLIGIIIALPLWHEHTHVHTHARTIIHTYVSVRIQRQPEARMHTYLQTRTYGHMNILTLTGAHRYKKIHSYTIILAY